MISVIIPVHNRKDVLKRTLESVLRQTFQQFEVWVVDDSSTDDPASVIRELNDPRIQFIRLETKSNGNVARNTGIKKAQGEYVAMLDSDDEWLPIHLEEKISFLNKTGADGVFGSVRIFDGKNYREKISRPFAPGENMANYLLGSGFAQTSSHVYKTGAIREVLFDESLHRHQDWDLCIRFAKKFKFLPDASVTCIVHWEKGLPKNSDYASQAAFINKYKSEISPENYSSYHMVMYRKAVEAGADASYVRHYLDESLKFVSYSSLNDFLTFRDPRNIFTKVLARIEFLFRTGKFS